MGDVALGGEQALFFLETPCKSFAFLFFFDKIREEVCENSGEISSKIKDINYMGYKYKKYRVRSPVKSFRDLEVYQISTNLSAGFYNLKLPSKYAHRKEISAEFNNLREISKHIPRLIVESYNDKFNELEVASQKLEKAAKIVNMAVAKIDFLKAVVDNDKFREELSASSIKYQRMKIRIINLKKAWIRVFGKKR